MTSDQEQRSGTIIRASDGTLYFITPKLLEACRVPEDERDLVERAQTTEGNEEFSFTRSQLEVVYDLEIALDVAVAMCQRTTSE